MRTLNRMPACAALLLLLALWAAGASAARGQSLLREVYENISGGTVDDLLASPRFPNNPDSTNYISEFEAPIDVLENYGQRVRGYVVPPATGSYVFWISSDDGSVLYLSTDESPANKRIIAGVASWTSSREWEKEAGQRSQGISLEANRRYYVEALMKEGGGGDNLAVRWQLPNGTMEEPIPGSRLVPFGVALTAPVISAQPANQTAVEGGSATFEVRSSNTDPLNYQWRKNGANISGATGSRYTIPAVAMADNGARFRVALSNSIGSVTSEEAVLAVTPDVTAPGLAALQNIGTTGLIVYFTEAVETASAGSPQNYTLNNGASVSGAAVSADGAFVTLSVSGLVYGTTYTLRVSNVRDRAASPNSIPANTEKAFFATEYAPRDIGSPSVAGGAQSIPNGFRVTGAGNGTLGGGDQFHFEYQPRSGNFDLKTRIAAFTAPDPWAVAGLMARETLEANSRFAASLATPASVGAFFQSRSAPGANPASAGSFPVNYPQTWLRLARQGNSFTAYASIDGQNWHMLGTASITMPSTIYVGQAVSSRSSSATASADFVELGAASGGTIGSFLPVREPLGPSTRRTGLVFSEIMYHPKDRADGKDLEFVELHNAGMIFEDLTGHRIAGVVNYTFPAGTVLPAGGFLVVARNPAQVREAHGLPTVLGPYSPSLPNSSGLLELRNAAGALLLEVEYSDAPPWPVAADGAGPSLALVHSSLGEADPAAWAASEMIGGSPGTAEPLAPNPAAAVVINEFLAHTDEPQMDFVELYNHSNTEVNISGFILTDDANENKFVIPNGTMLPAGGFMAFDQAQLGFSLSSEGEAIYLINAAQTRVIDSVAFGPQENGVASGRSPNGSSTIRRLAGPTPGASNSAYEVPQIVINEIMYHPISENDDDEYVELHNRGTTPVNVGGWMFTDGIDYLIPANTTIAAGGYLVVARDAARLRSRYPNLTPANTVGNYSGSLANSGERLALSMPDEIISVNSAGQSIPLTIYIDVAEVAYGEGGRWGVWSDGGGSSLELIDPDSDHLRPSNWADSDESAKSQWSTIEFTGTLDNGNSSYPANSLQMHMLGAGECLVDNVEALRGGSADNLVANGSFESGSTGWAFQGNHRKTAVEDGVGVGGGRALHVRTTGRGDTGANRIRRSLSGSLNVGGTATLRAQVRWLKGHPEFLLRLRGNWLEAAGPMSVPTNLGTPGARNSQAAPNAGPAIYDVSHSPVLPAANQAVTVTARISDPQGVSQPVLRFRIDPSSSVTTVAMNDNGTGADAVADDGIYSATMAGRQAGTLAAFHVQASDGAASPVQTRFPSDAPARECLVRWGEPQAFGNLGSYRLWRTQAVWDTLTSREPLANDPLDATFVYNNSRVIYNIGMRGKGSPFHGGSIGVDYLFAFPDDDKFLGDTDMALVTVGNTGNDSSAQREQAAYWIARQMSIPYLYRRYVHFYVNGSRQGSVYEDTEEPNGRYIEGWFPSDPDGDLYKIEDWFEFDDNAAGFSNVDATLQRFTTTGGALKLARYRWDWRKRALNGSANDYTNLFNLVNAVNAPAATYTAAVESLVDVEQWMRVFALEHIVGNWDAYGYNRGKNMYTYKPVNGKWAMMAWDIDFVLGSGSDGPTTDVFSANDPSITRMYGHPPFLRSYWRAFEDAVNGPLVAVNIGPVLDARYKALMANLSGVGVSVTDPESIKSWVESRRAYLASRLNSVSSSFAITTSGGNDFSTAQSLLTLAGTAPIAVKTIRVNGVEHPVTWTDVRTWNLRIPLTARVTSLDIRGYDLRGNLVAGATDAVTITYTGTIESAQGSVVINEIMYNAADSGASYVELHNASATTTFNLSNWRIDGIGFVFPEGTLLNPGGYVVVARERGAFAAAYGAGIPVAGEFTGSLDNGGETLRLIIPGATSAQDIIVAEVKYDDDPPWPASADGLGPSLQLIDPARDNFRVSNWAAADVNAAVKFTPGAANSVRGTVSPYPLVWLNEVMASNVAGAQDRFGDRDPWLELYNSSDAAIDLSEFYLSDQTANLARWQFPAGTTIGPRQFLLVWLDGEANETGAGELHASFRPNAMTGLILLSRVQSGSLTLLDYLGYESLSASRSFGSFPDGQGMRRQVFHFPTPGAANNPASAPVALFINEWMASNNSAYADPADGQFEDWFELYNPDDVTVDLAGYKLTDTLGNPNKYSIPAGVSIPAGGYLVVWADEEEQQNGVSDLHVNFKLSADGETIGLFSPDGTLVDSVTFGSQRNNVSEGRATDGAAPPFVSMPLSTPGNMNVVSTFNKPPVLAAIGGKTVDEGALLAFQAAATDPDAGQALTFSLGADAPAGAAITPGGQFTWTPGEAQGPGVFGVTVRVTDNGAPNLSDFERITVTVSEINTAPVFAAMPDRTVDEGAPLELSAAATDSDIPQQTLIYSIGSGSPEGVNVNVETGALSWTPSEAQGPGTHRIHVVASDNGFPAASATNSFTVTVNEVNQRPVIPVIEPKIVYPGEVLSFQFPVADPDIPAQRLAYSLNLPFAQGASIDAGTGVFTFRPDFVPVPSTNTFFVTVTDNGSPSQSAQQTFKVIVQPLNRPPVIAAIANRTVVEGSRVGFLVSASDPDVPAQNLVYALEPGAPAGAEIDVNNGTFSWTPTEAQGPSTNTITVRVSDDSLRRDSATASFVITVTETNAAPVIAAIADHTVVVGETLTIAVAATDSDLPANTLHYELGQGAPGGAAIDPATGVFSWTPLEEQSHTTNQIIVRVTDSGSPARSVSQTFAVRVIPAEQWVFASVTGTASSSVLYIYLDGAGSVHLDDMMLVAGSQAETGPNLLPNGGFEEPLSGPWTVSPNLAPSSIVTASRRSGNGSLRVVSTQGGSTRGSSIFQEISPALQNGETYTLSYWYLPGTNNVSMTIRLSGNGIVSSHSVYTPPNIAPVLATVQNRNVDEETPLAFTVQATDANTPPQTLRYSLDAGAPEGASVDPATGVFSWTPTERQGPFLHFITVRVRDNGSPPLSHSRTFSINVREVNRAPVLAPLGEVSVAAGAQVRVTNSVTDLDFPDNIITFSLEPDAPAGSAVDAATGVLTWTPSAAMAGSSRQISVRATDNGGLSATQTLTVHVTASAQIRMFGIERRADGGVTFSWSAVSGRTYGVQYRDDLASGFWTNLGSPVTAAGAQASQTDIAPSAARRFYRVRQLD